MREYGDVMREVAERHVAQWPRGRSFAVLPSMQAITLEIIMRVVFGVDEDRMERLGKPLRKLLDSVASRWRVLALGLTAERDWSFGPWATFVRTKAEADALLDEEIRARHADPAGSDIFSMLVSASDADGQGLSDSDLRDELMTLLVAGHETTATALSWTLERLARHPDVLAKVVAEQRDGGDEYLDAVIKETLRLRPVVPAVVRELQEPMTLGGWEIPAGLNVAPSIYLLHRRPDLYPEPDAFRPERFLGRNPGTYEWIPFGGGVRRCLGASFALYEMKVVLSHVLGALTLKKGRGSEPIQRRAITLAPSRGGRIAIAA
jgi:cytochrome P450